MQYSGRSHAPAGPRHMVPACFNWQRQGISSEQGGRQGGIIQVKTAAVVVKLKKVASFENMLK